jgi:hypothetical protein
MVDLDCPLGEPGLKPTPLANQCVSRLHWLVTALTLSNATPPPDGTSTAVLSIPDPPVVQYTPPAPPAGDIEHRSSEAHVLGVDVRWYC